jgi:hypothetical protein
MAAPLRLYARQSGDTKVQAFRHWLLPEMERFRNILSQWN